MIFSGGAQHGRSADIDIFDSIFKRTIEIRDGLAKGVQVDDQQINPVNTVLIDGLEVFGAVATRQEAAVNLWVEGFDTAIEDFGGAGVLRDFGDRESRLGE